MTFSPVSRLRVILCAVVFVLAANALVTWWNLDTLAANNAKVGETTARIGLLQEFLSTLKDLETGQRGYLLTSNEAYLLPYLAARQSLGGLLDQVRAIAADLDDRRRLAGLERDVARKLAVTESSVAAMKKGDRDEALALVRLGEGRITMNALRKTIDEWVRIEESELMGRVSTSRRSLVRTVAAFAGATALGLVLIGALYGASLQEKAARRRYEARLAERAEHWRVTLSSVGDAVIVTDAEGRITFLNAMAEALCGVNRADVIGRDLAPIFRVVNAGTRKPEPNPVRHVLDTGVAQGLSGQGLLIRPGGEERPIDDGASPIRREDGTIQGVVLVFRDVAESREAQRRLAEINARLVSIVEGINDGFITLDPHCKYTYVNKTAEEMLGVPREGLLGRDFWELNPRAISTRLEGEFRKALAERVTIAFDEFDDSRKRWLAWKVYPTTGGEVALFFRDVTEARNVEEEKRLDSERIRLAVEAAEVGAWDFDPASGTLVWDERVHRQFATPEGFLPDYAGFLNALHPDDRARIDLEVADAIDVAGLGEMKTEYRVIGMTDGVERWIASRGQAFFEGGRAVRFIGTTVDVTEEKRAEEALRLADRQKDEFLAMLSHEIRNPLSSIVGALRLARRSESAEDVVWARDVIERQAAQLGYLVDDLLDVSRMAQGKVTLQLSRCDLGELVGHAADAARTMVEQRGHRLTVEVDRGALPIDVDPKRMEQVLTNLLTNAAKYTPDGGNVALKARREGELGVITLRDDGIGIPRDMLPHVFELFTQVDLGSERSQGGLGIGLKVVQGLVEMHRGTISVASDGPGRGSEFTIRLPLALGAPPALPSPPLPDPSLRSGAPRRVLVVDDNADSARSLSRLLRMDGHSVVTAQDGTSALGAALDHRPEVVLLDIGLPGMDGYEVARRLRESDLGRNALLIAVSGFGQERDRRLANEAGFNHHLVKPIDFDLLARLLASTPPDHDPPPRPLSGRRSFKNHARPRRRLCTSISP